MDTQSIIPQSDDRLFSYLLKECAINLLDIPLDQKEKEGDKSKIGKDDTMITLYLLGLILITSTEPLKVLLRRNIGKLSLSLPRLVVACILFGLWSLILFFVRIKYDHRLECKTGMFAGAIFYASLSLVVLALGIMEYIKAVSRYNENPKDIMKHIYRGDSVYFGYLENKGWKLKRIWLVAEPLFCFSTGVVSSVLFAFIDPLLTLIGLPIVLSSVSFWFNEWFQINNVWDAQSKKIFKENEKALRMRQYGIDDGFASLN